MPEQVVLPAAALPARGSLLAFDFGLARTGVAVGELETGHAAALQTIHADTSNARFTAVSRFVEEWQPIGFVVGVPLSPDGSEQAMTARCRRFANQLRGRYRLPVWECDERYSSTEADDRLQAGGRKIWQQRKQHLDSVAAQLILQTFLDSRS